MKLDKEYFNKNTLLVAKKLLGKYLVRDVNNIKFVGKIIETEAYVGMNDKACHAAKGMTKRNEVMFGEAGHAYVYMIYGMYNCLNIVTENIDYPAAVLIRALEPIESVERMKIYRNNNDEYNFCSGPGKLCQALNIDRKLNGESLQGEKLWIEDRGDLVNSSDVVKAKRVGIDYAGKCKDYLWRFYIKDNRYISKK